MAGRCYAEFYESIRSSLNGRPISFQIWEDDEDLARRQIDAIHAIDSRIFVKIPIHNSCGEPNDALFRYCSKRGIPVNVTSLYTYEQIDRASKCLKDSTAPLIVSVFAGPISDTGIDPGP
jgi:transaldolase